MTITATDTVSAPSSVTAEQDPAPAASPAGGEVLLAAEGLCKRFPVAASKRVSFEERWRGALARPHLRRSAAPAPSLLHAVEDVSFTIGRGECVGLVGESGCGKSTLSRLLTRLLEPTEGRITFDGRDLREVPVTRFARSPLRARIQQVFQDPTDSLNPRLSAFAAIADPLKRVARLRGAALTRRVEELAAQVSLPHALLTRYPHQLSGGQKARVGIARAIALSPSLLILDEPTAALDVSVQAVILQLLDELRVRLGMSYLFVTHDLSLVRLLCHRLVVMYLGRVVETGPVDAVFARPRHPYTRSLLAAIPEIEGKGPPRAEAEARPRARLQLHGEPRSPIDPAPHVCSLSGRCPEEVARCRSERPALRALGGEGLLRHEAACHHAR